MSSAERRWRAERGARGRRRTSRGRGERRGERGGVVEGEGEGEVKVEASWKRMNVAREEDTMYREGG